MLIRIRRRDNKFQKMQMVEAEGIVAAACSDSTVCYKCQNPVFQVLCGSI